jgi:signal peptidase II
MQATGEPALTDSDEPDRASLESADTSAVSRVGWQGALLAGTAVVAFAADLATKTWIVHSYADGHVTTLIPDVFEIEQTRNPGAAFGLAGGATIVFSLVAVAVVVLIVRSAARLRSWGWAIALGLLLGGAVGNLGDRIFRSPGVFRGHVVDWIYVHHWPVFNIADSAITVGGVIAVILASRGHRFDGKKEHPNQDVSSEVS